MKFGKYIYKNNNHGQDRESGTRQERESGTGQERESGTHPESALG